MWNFINLVPFLHLFPKTSTHKVAFTLACTGVMDTFFYQIFSLIGGQQKSRFDMKNFTIQTCLKFLCNQWWGYILSHQVIPNEYPLWRSMDTVNPSLTSFKANKCYNAAQWYLRSKWFYVNRLSVNWKGRFENYYFRTTKMQSNISLQN